MGASEKLYRGLGNAAWGYFFLLFDFRINGVNLLPAFIGYLLFFSAIHCFAEDTKERSVLGVFGAVLTFWYFFSWLRDLLPLGIPEVLWQGLVLTAGIANIYFQYRMLTNIASVAEGHQAEGATFDRRVLTYRTLITVLLSILLAVGQVLAWFNRTGLIMTLGVAVVQIVVGILLMKTLFDLRKQITQDEAEEEEEPSP